MAIQLALKEWQHWLEEAKPLFIIFTDHKNRQMSDTSSSWLVFVLLTFPVHVILLSRVNEYQGDALCLLHGREIQDNHNKFILPPSCVISCIEWELDQDLARIPRSQIPTACPPKKQFIPDQHRVELISWAHTGVATGHLECNALTTYCRRSTGGSKC